MKIVSTFLDDITLTAGKCHTVSFKDSKQLSNFRELFTGYFKNRNQKDYNYIKLLDNEGRKIKGRDFYFLEFDCSTINLKKDRSTEKQIKEILYYYLENHPSLIDDYINISNQINDFLNKITLKNKALEIEFASSDKTINQLVNSLSIDINYMESDEVPNFILRNFLIRALLDLNALEKEVILFISYPETDVGLKDFQEMMKLLKELNVTTIILTSHFHILTDADIKNIFCFQENGTIYDIEGLKKELIILKEVFDEQNSESLAKYLAYHDYIQNYTYLDKNHKTFLLSSRI